METTCERRVYVDHKQHGTCITYEARVYVAPTDLKFDKKQVIKLRFTVSSDRMIGPDGRVWVCKGKNPGCGPRLPKELRDRHGKEFGAMTHVERKEFLKSLTPAK